MNTANDKDRMADVMLTLFSSEHSREKEAWVS